MKKIRVFISCLIVLVSFTGFGCAQNNSLQKKYGQDSAYFMALLSLENGNQRQAEHLLKQAEKKASPLIARRSMEKLSQLGNVQERINRSYSLYKKFPDEETKLAAAKEFFENKEYARVIRFTEKIDLKNCLNETAYYRLSSMHKKNDSRFSKEFFEWCVSRTFSDLHYKLFCETFKSEETEESKVIQLRADVFTKNYVAAYSNAKSLLESKKFLFPQILSDAGKSFLYGSNSFFSNAIYLDSIKNSLPDDCKFYADFYSGRLYDKADAYKTRALNRFVLAMQESLSDANFDNALWYYLNCLLRISVPKTIDAISQYKDEWKAPSYFDDFFETLSVRLLSLHAWNDLFKTADLIYGKASPEISAKYSYISARLIQENFIKPSKEKSEEEHRLFSQALQSGSDLYYRFLAIKKLELAKTKAEEIIFSVGNKKEIQPDIQAEKLLLGYADFGLKEFIYPEYQKLQDKIGIECAEKIAEFLSQCGKGQESIRIASRRLFSKDQPFQKKLLELSFPQYFKESVQKSCQDFSQPEYLLYGLIRSESFFNPNAKSNAGAKGLTQLMEGTAADVARKLKVAQFDLMDSATNIRFGSFYLEELRRRLDGSSILAIFSYNGGISRVRSWVKSANLEFGTSDLPKDLFLEAIPFSETREYGRKVVSAAAMYGYLYYGLSTSQVVEEIMK
ncbi:transglycosylase SLT domain-containing protein [uncultured Treponema sp.]|uniref:flagellar assembly lytic transglycosylase n=1 Tax=uncultured Treponema sp. TaxID=162155 RepID=UPI0025DBC433|nr:transglycosylase SLT domain-containing protein [uncultured Treponema sp.]